MNYLGLTIALFLPWFLGYVWVRLLWSWQPSHSTHPHATTSLLSHLSYHVALHLGYGYILGILATTLLMRVWNAAGFKQDFLALSLILAALTGFGAIVLRKRTRRQTPPLPRRENESAASSALHGEDRQDEGNAGRSEPTIARRVVISTEPYSVWQRAAFCSS
jgi:hypothetical protein